MVTLLLLLALSFPLALTQARPQPVTSLLRRAEPLGSLIDLGYTKVQGVAYPNGISQWLGVRYAQPPLGKLRFAAPQPVTPSATTQQATGRGHYCIGTRENTNNPVNLGAASEDCLLLDIYAPYGVTADSKLPVFVFIPGGGFNNAYPSQNGSSLVEASGYKIIVVSINYRVSAYGFLASTEVKNGGSINNGLKDQRMALEWLHDNIAKFGGDPGHVVIGGSSAGAGSVTLQATAYNGRNDNLFHGVIVGSQSFAALRTVCESQYQYDALVTRTNCANAVDTLDCLRNLDTITFQTANTVDKFPSTDPTYPPLFAYNPTMDNDFISDYTLKLYASNRFLNIPSIYGDPTNDGTTFTPRSVGPAVANRNSWLRAQFPALNSTHLSTIQRLYPPEEENYGSGAWWRSTANAYGDLRYVCPGLFLNYNSARYAPNVGTWNYNYNVEDPDQINSGNGVPHVAEQAAVWNSANGGSYTTTNKPIVGLMQGYWVSFIRDLNPNTYRVQGAPEWKAWGNGGGLEGGRLLVQSPGPGGDLGTTRMETVNRFLKAKCEGLLAFGVDIKQ